VVAIGCAFGLYKFISGDVNQVDLKLTLFAGSSNCVFLTLAVEKAFISSDQFFFAEPNLGGVYLSTFVRSQFTFGCPQISWVVVWFEMVFSLGPLTRGFGSAE